MLNEQWQKISLWNSAIYIVVFFPGVHKSVVVLIMCHQVYVCIKIFLVKYYLASMRKKGNTLDLHFTQKTLYFFKEKNMYISCAVFIGINNDLLNFF